MNGGKDEGYYLLKHHQLAALYMEHNNVTLGEVMHTALAYWQGGENDNAFKLWKVCWWKVCMAAPARVVLNNCHFMMPARENFAVIFADGIGVTARTLTEGLFGILPDALENNKLLIRPGFPSSWKFAKLKVPDISIDFK